MLQLVESTNNEHCEYETEERILMEKQLMQQDPAVYNAIKDELRRQRTKIELIASENFVTKQ